MPEVTEHKQNFNHQGPRTRARLHLAHFLSGCGLNWSQMEHINEVILQFKDKLQDTIVSKTLPHTSDVPWYCYITLSLILC